MKKYIIPTSDVAMLSEHRSIMLDSFEKKDETTTVGGTTTDNGEDLGQLTRDYGWEAADWGDDR